MEREMKSKEEQANLYETKYTSQKDEAEDKTKKLKVLWLKLKELEAENKEIDDIYSAEIDEL